MPTSVALSTVDIAQKLREYQEKGAKTIKFGYNGSPKDRTIFLSANQLPTCSECSSPSAVCTTGS